MTERDMALAFLPPAKSKRVGGVLALGLAAVLAAVASNPAAAQAPVSFEGKTVTMLVGFPAGGGTDASARTLAPFLTKYLPGNPNVIISNLPGADGMIAMNSFVQRTKPDGLTITMGSTTLSDPLQYRRPQAHFDPTKFKFIGGLGRGGTILVIRTDAEKRLHDKSAPPVVMGSIGGIPRSGMQSTAWGIAYLGWNAKWVVGYRGTKELFLALERGEIDMTATGNLGQVQRMLDAGVVKILTQSGTIKNGERTTRPEFGDAPVLASLVEEKIKDPIEKQSFAYWTNLTSVDKWLALPPDTPDAIVKVYQHAYDQMTSDPDFIALGQKISEEIEPQPGADVARIVNILGSIQPQAIEQIDVMLRKQGLDTQ
jgi:tripartite-type tricarboxylate transporter receptor subunit TctC